MTAREPLDLDGILTDISGHSAELPVDVVDCVGCHIAVTDVPALVAEVKALRAEVAEHRRTIRANDAARQSDAMHPLPERTAVPGEPLPPLPNSAYPPDAEPLDSAPTGHDAGDHSRCCTCLCDEAARAEAERIEREAHQP